MRRVVQAVILSVCTVLGGCAYLLRDRSLPNCPARLAGNEMFHGSSFDRSNFGTNDVAFLKDRLFVASNKGLLEFDQLELTATFKCHSGPYDLFTNVVADADGNLWTSNFQSGNPLLHFDGRAWQAIELPTGGEPFTRRDVERLRSFLVNSDLWLQTSKEVWRWDNETSLWTSVALPDVGCPNDVGEALGTWACFVSIAPLKDTVAFVLRSSFCTELSNGGPDPACGSDRIFVLKEGEWKNIVPAQLEGLHTKEVVSNFGRAFIRTYDDHLYKISSDSVEPLPSLGRIDAVAATSEGSLIAAVSGRGVYEFKTEWIKRFDYPVELDANPAVHIQESAGKIALVLGSFSRGDDPETYRGDRLWLYVDGKLEEARF